MPRIYERKVLFNLNKTIRFKQENSTLMNKVIKHGTSPEVM